MTSTLYYDQHEGLARAIVKTNGAVAECFFAPQTQAAQTGMICLATVDRLLQGNRHAFLRLPDGSTGFLNDAEDLQGGDEVLVQIKSESRGNKGPGLTRNISLPGVYFIHQPDGEGVSFSRRLDEAGRRHVGPDILAMAEAQPGGWVLRKSCRNAKPEALEREIAGLAAFAEKLDGDPDANGIFLPPPSAFEQGLISAAAEESFEIVVEEGIDLHAQLDNLSRLCPAWTAALKPRLAPHAFDEGDLESFFHALLQEKLPLPQGGSVVFARNEALNVIDVNGGERNRGAEVNHDAARLIMEQIRFRNIGGLIVIDFLKMKSRDERDALTGAIMNLASRDAHAMDVYGFTRMGLFEISRARRGFALDEVMNGRDS